MDAEVIVADKRIVKVVAAAGLAVVVLAAVVFGYRYYTTRSMSEGTPPSVAGSEPQNPITAAAPILSDYAPQIIPIAEDGVVPQAIRVQFVRPVTNDTSSVSSDNVISFDPPVAGSWRYETQSALLFTPSDAFKFSTSYLVRIDSVSIDGVKVLPNADFKVERVFETPPFGAKRASVVRVNPATNSMEFEIVFTGAVDYQTAEKYIRLGAENKNLPAKFSVGSNRNSIIAQVSMSAIGKAETVRVSALKGLPGLQTGHQLPREEHFTVDLFAGPDVDIKLTQLKEGANGFYIQVVCNDSARAPDVDDSYQNRIYYYDSETSEGMYVSDRCSPDEQSVSQTISFSPAVDFSVVPSRGGFRILGNFQFGDLNMVINPGLRTVDGGVLKTIRTHQFNVPRRKPQVSLVAQGRYLARDAWKSISIKHMNAAEAELEVRHIPIDNVIFWIGGDSERANDRNSNLIHRATIKLGGGQDTLETRSLALNDILSQAPRGVLEFSIRDKSPNSNVDVKRLIATDINLLVKRRSSNSQVDVWSLDFHKVSPKNGVTVKMITRSGRALASCETSGDGHCTLKWDQTKEIDPAQPFAIIASKDDDFTYLKFDELKTEVAEQLIQGRPFSGGVSPYRAAIYSDRGVYRPGESAHLVGILRDANNVAPSVDMPATLELFDPREKLFKKINLKLNEAGMIDADIRFESFAATGKYKAVIKAGEAEIGNYYFSVEDFMPERMKVDVKPLSTDLVRNQQASFLVEARYLFGGSAAGSNVELSCELLPSEFKPEKNSNFFYGVFYPDNKAPKSLALESVAGKISESDTVKLSCPVSEKVGGFAGSAKLRAVAAVFEGESGRSTQNSATIPVHPESFYIGLSSGLNKLQKGDTFLYEGIIVDWNGEIVKKDETVQLEFVRLESEYDWSWDDRDGSSYRRYLRQITEGRFTVEVKNGRFKGSIPVNSNASGFLLRASLGKARTDLSVAGSDNDYYWWPSETSRDQTPRPLKPGWIQITGADNIKRSNPVKVEVVAPFKGRLLLTAETDEIVASKWMDVEAGKTTWEFKLDKFSPNIYVSAFMIKDPHLESSESFMPDRAFGVRSFRIEPEEYSDSISVQVAEEIRPNSTLTVDLQFPSSETGRFVTVAAVDEGILSLTKFKSPDPIRTIFEPRALGIETFETFGWNVMLPGSGTSSTHGGDEDSGDKSVSLVKPVALWSGLLQVPENGKMSVSLEVPQYSGQLRVMVVSADKKRIASNSASVFVRDPLVLQTSLPRFVTEGDEFDIPVTVTNLSGKVQDVALSVDVVNLMAPGDDADVALVEVKAPAIPKVSLDLGASKTLVFKAAVVAPVGAVQFRVRAEAAAIESFENLDVPIISAKPRSRSVKRLDLTSGDVDLKAHLDAFVPMTEKTSFWVTNNPYADSMQHLTYLVSYPHGCVEQTTSATRPLLVIRDLLDQVGSGAFGTDGNIDDMVRRGIERILSMQTSSGGFAYWPGMTTPTLWATAYATHMLLDAKKLNFPVAEERINEALQYMYGQMVNNFRYVSNVYGDHPSDTRDAAAYMYYVLALGGKGLKADTENFLGQLNNSKSTNSEISEQRYLLMAALYLMGDHRFEGDLKHPDISPVTAVRRNSWSFYSDFRRRGLMLSVFVDLFGNDVAGTKLADLVAEYLRGKASASYTTQELVWSVTGLGKFVAGGSGSFDASLLVNGKPRKPQAPNSWIVPQATERSDLKLKVSKKAEGNLYLVIASEGVLKETDFKTGGEGIEITRTYRKPDGGVLNIESGVALAGMIYTELTIRNKTGERVDNIALVDRFPAGWEIENPRLGRGTTQDFIDPEQAWQADYMNIRDDRIELFGGLNPGETRKVWYASRAILGGRFRIPPVEAEAMYNPRIWAREAGGVTNVKGPWNEVSGQ